MTLEDRIEDFRKSLEFWGGVEPSIQKGELKDALTRLACELTDILPLLEELQTLRKAYELACFAVFVNREGIEPMGSIKKLFIEAAREE